MMIICKRSGSELSLMQSYSHQPSEQWTAPELGAPCQTFKVLQAGWPAGASLGQHSHRQEGSYCESL